MNNLPDDFEQMELFGQPEKSKKNQKKEPLMSEKDLEFVFQLDMILMTIRLDARNLKGQDLLISQKDLIMYAIDWLGAPEYLVKDYFLPLYNIPDHDHEYMLEHLLRLINSDLCERYIRVRETK